MVNVMAGLNTFLLKTGSDFDGSQEIESIDVEGVNAPTVEIFFTPSSIDPGQGSVLEWNSEHAESCKSDQDPNIKETTGTLTYVRSEPGDWNVKIFCTGQGGEASASATLTVKQPAIWSLTNDKRRGYLQFYSPVIFKRADENDREHHGFDLVTNFDFDRDDTFLNNRQNWRQIHEYVGGNPNLEHWRIRPTVYSAIVEFMEDDGSKSVVLIYHIYHALQKGSIHDWERIEIRVDHVNGTPGGRGERLNFVVITEHSKHHHKKKTDDDLNFMETRTGEHALIWQAQWSGDVLQPNRAELRFVEDSWSEIERRVADDRDAQVEVTGDGEKKKANYVFVCVCSSAAKNYWAAQEINRQSAPKLIAGVKDKVAWSEVRRITYELQDLADILPSHTAGGGYERHWGGQPIMIDMVTPLLDEGGETLITTGIQDFYYTALDYENAEDAREGYPYKSWFWGAYKLDGKHLKKEAFDGDENAFQGGTRGAASGRLDSHEAYWLQHDYFAHDGRGSSNDGQSGRWLKLDWQSIDDKGGFDGRWVQLFQD